MRRRLLFPLLFLAACLLGRAETVEFTVASLNVDGMPPSLLNGLVKLNPDAQEGAGATNIGNGIKRFVWDFVALSEDFNYHDDLMAPISQYYYAGTHRGKLYNKIDVLTSPFKTDGLGFLWKKDYTVASEMWWGWNKKNGKTKDGSDELIDKGFRYYLVELAPGLEVDVYIHHMDAETSAADNAARESQLAQLRDHILQWSTNRPIIIMGDTNCRWTRDPLQSVFFDPINADPRFDIHDPWVEFMWGEEGGYDAPALQQGQPSIMTHTYGSQKGEVVDKIFYINNTGSEVKLTALSFRSEVTFTFNGQEGGVPLADHFPLVVKFRAEMPTIKSGVDYFIRNKATGQFINQGLDWGTQAITYDYGMRIQLQNLNSDNYYLKTTAGYLKDALYVDGRYRPDKNTDERSAFKIEEAGPNNKYVKISTGGQYLKAGGKDSPIQKTGTANDDYTLWELLTTADLTTELQNATESNPIDATFFIRGANFNRMDFDNDSWSVTKKDKSNASYKYYIDNNSGLEEDWGRGREANYVAEFYNDAIGTGSNSEWNMQQTLTGLPAGKYKLCYNGFRREGSATVSLGNASKQLMSLGDQYTKDPLGDNSVNQFEHKYQSSPGIFKTETKHFNGYVPNGMNGASDYFSAGYYRDSLEVVIDTNSAVLKIDKSGNTSRTWTCFDNFRLTYLGPTAEMLAGRDRVKEALDDVASILPLLDDKGRGNYNNSLVEQAYAKNKISTSGESEVRDTYATLATAAKAQTTRGADMSYAINNWSFEMGWMTQVMQGDSKDQLSRHHPYWCSLWTDDTYVRESGNPGDTYYCNNTHKEYLFNTWGKGDHINGPISQNVTGLPEGVYILSAWVASDAGNRAYVHANGNVSTENVLTKGSGELVKVSMEVIVEDGQTLCLGAGAVAQNVTPTVPKSSAEEMWNLKNANSAWFKADNFGLTYVCNLSFRLLQKAIDDAKAKAQAKGLTVDLSKWQKMVNDRTVSEDATQEVLEVYQALGQAVLQSNLQDKTLAIVNNSFELADWGLNVLGWEQLSPLGDSGARLNSDNTYKMSSCDGKYMFNTWREGRGTIIWQTIPNPPAGHYVISAIAANDANKYVYFEVKGDPNREGQKSDPIKLTDELGTGKRIQFEFEVAADTPEITIYFGGCNSDGTYDDFGGDWYKVDNFQLVRIGDEDLCFFYRRLQAAIDDATDIARKLPKKYSSQWDVNDYQDLVDNHINSNHDDEGLGSGLAEIDTIYTRLRELIYSQTETEAIMTGAIKNHSFEMGDLTGWTIASDPIADTKVVIGNEGGTYGTSGIDGKYLFNCFLDGSGRAVYQTIPALPAGIYKLSALVASFKGNKFFLAAGDSHSELITIDKDKEYFTRYYVQFEVTEESSDVVIGLYPTLTDNFNPSDNAVSNGWYRVDDFELELVGRRLNIPWTMETPSHGTIMLPFDVTADKLAQEKLEVYSISKSSHPTTVADPEVNTYHILTFKKEDYIKANTPYVVKNLAASASNSKRKTVTEGGDVHYFTGLSTNKQDTTKTGLLIGTLITRPANIDEHHLVEYAENVGFVHHALAENTEVPHDSIDAYHAFIFHPIEENNEIVTGFYFYEPSLPIRWTMEGQHYGTLMLPFNADIPVEFYDHSLAVYRITGLSEEKEYEAEDGIHHFTYRIMEREKVDEIQANVPYLVMTEFEDMKAPAKKILPRKAAATAKEGDPDALTQEFQGVATNSKGAYTSGLLTGVFTTTEVDSTHYTLYQHEETGNFQRGPEAAEDEPATVAETSSTDGGYSTTIEPYHAYIDAAQNPDKNFLFFAAPNEEEVSGIEDILSGEAGNVDVYDLQGVLLRSDLPVGEALDGLSAGVYILRCGETTVKVLK